MRPLLPEDGEVAGLLALMLLTDARRSATDLGGGRAGDPRRAGPSVWDARRIAEGHELVRERLAGGAPRVATRCSRPSTRSTPTPATPATPTGRRSLALYDQLARHRPLAHHRAQPCYRSRRARRPGCRDRDRRAASSRELDRLPRLPRDHAPTCCDGWAAPPEARAAYDRAIELAGNTAEIAYLTHRRDGTPTPPGTPIARMALPITSANGTTLAATGMMSRTAASSMRGALTATGAAVMPPLPR